MYCKYEDMYYSWLVDLWIIVEPNLFIDKYYIEIVECLALLGISSPVSRSTLPWHEFSSLFLTNQYLLIHHTC